VIEGECTSCDPIKWGSGGVKVLIEDDVLHGDGQGEDEDAER
jgi:hypothetical protein